MPFQVVADINYLHCFHTGLGGRKTRQRERHMMKDFDVITTHENVVGLWPGKPSHLQHVLTSATAPVLTAGSKPVTSVGSSALVALKKKQKKFFSASRKNRGSPDKQISRVSKRSSPFVQRATQPFQRVQFQRQRGLVKGTMLSPSTTTESVTSHSSDTMES